MLSFPHLGRLVFPSGFFRIAVSINLSPNVNIIGENKPKKEKDGVTFAKYK
jgi:hypothetical protein